MSKFIIILLVATFAAAINADLFGDMSSMANPDQWMDSISSGMDKGMKNLEKQIETTVPGANEQFQGHSHQESHSTVVEDGKVKENKDARKDVDNVNGVISSSTSGNQ